MPFIAFGLRAKHCRIERIEKAGAAYGATCRWRDFTTCGRCGRAYLLAAERGATGETYNICSGVSAPSATPWTSWGLARTAFAVEVDTQLCRPLDVPEMRGSYAKFHACTGWQPEVAFDRILEDLLDYWRKTTA